MVRSSSVALSLFIAGSLGCSSASSASGGSTDAGRVEPAPDGGAATAACIRGVVPIDAQCAHVSPASSAKSFGPSDNGGYLSHNRWLVTWGLPGDEQLQLWMRSDVVPRAGACQPYVSPPSLEMLCDGALATVGVYPSTCNARTHGLPGCNDDLASGSLPLASGGLSVESYLVASGSLELSAVDPGVARWAGRIGQMKLVETCSIPTIETIEIVPKLGGRCYIVDEASWDSRVAP